jgi:hypothetical protein
MDYRIAIVKWISEKGFKRDMIKRKILRAKKTFNLGKGGMKKQLQLLSTAP